MSDVSAIARVASIDASADTRARCGGCVGLDNVVGFRVVRTISDGRSICDDGPVHGEIIDVFDGAASYGAALECAHAHRHGDDERGRLIEYAVVDTLYGCGVHAGR